MRKNILILACALCGCSPIGEQFADVDAIAMSDTWKDWVVVGKFGPNGPFTLVDMKECGWSQPCNFSHEGQGHTYDKFYDFRLTVLRLEGPQGQVSHVVLRSKEDIYGGDSTNPRTRS